LTCYKHLIDLNYKLYCI